MVKIGIIGATGNAGSAIYKEATERGHEVTAIVRDADKAKEKLGENVSTIISDAFELTKDDLSGFDVIVNAFATSPDQVYLHVDLTARLVSFFRETESPRLFFILGAGSLRTEAGHLFIEEIKKAPNSEQWIAIPDNQRKQLEFLKKVNNVNWVGISPGATFQEGEKQEFIMGEDHILFNVKDESVTNAGTLAVAIVDEIESNNYKRQRFTVINK